MQDAAAALPLAHPRTAADICNVEAEDAPQLCLLTIIELGMQRHVGEHGQIQALAGEIIRLETAELLQRSEHPFHIQIAGCYLAIRIRSRQFDLPAQDLERNPANVAEGISGVVIAACPRPGGDS